MTISLQKSCFCLLVLLTAHTMGCVASDDVCVTEQKSSEALELAQGATISSRINTIESNSLFPLSTYCSELHTKPLQRASVTYNQDVLTVKHDDARFSFTGEKPGKSSITLVTANGEEGTLDVNVHEVSTTDISWMQGHHPHHEDDVVLLAGATLPLTLGYRDSQGIPLVGDVPWSGALPWDSICERSQWIESSNCTLHIQPESTRISVKAPGRHSKPFIAQVVQPTDIDRVLLCHEGECMSPNLPTTQTWITRTRKNFRMDVLFVLKDGRHVLGDPNSVQIDSTPEWQLSPSNRSNRSVSADILQYTATITVKTLGRTFTYNVRVNSVR